MYNFFMPSSLSYTWLWNSFRFFSYKTTPFSSLHPMFLSVEHNESARLEVQNGGKRVSRKDFFNRLVSLEMIHVYYTYYTYIFRDVTEFQIPISDAFGIQFLNSDLWNFRFISAFINITILELELDFKIINVLPQN